MIVLPNSDAAACHKKCSPSPEEIAALAIAREVLADAELARVCEQESLQPKPDFRSPRHAVEVKELASPSLRSYRHAETRHFGRHFEPVDGLAQTWFLLADLSGAVRSYDPRTETPTVKSLVAKLRPLLLALEQRGLDDARKDQQLWAQVAALVDRDAHLSVIPVKGNPYGAGLIIGGHLHSHERTTDIEWDVVGLLQKWLESGYATNAIASVAGEIGRRRALVLIADLFGPAEALVNTLAETPGQVPVTPLQLPEGVDAVIVISGDDIVDFGVVDGWRRHTR